MPYLPNIPIGTDQLSVSQPQIQSNFTILQTAFDINHIDFDAANAGKHMYVELPVAAGNPIPPIVFAAGEVALYSALNPTTNQNELYINKSNNGPVVTQIPATASTLSGTPLPNASTGFWTYLPSGLIAYSGNASGTGAGFSGFVTVSPTIAIAGGPGLQRILSVIVCPFNGTLTDLDFAVRLVSMANATFIIYISRRTNTGVAAGQAGYSYLAVGV